MSWTDEKKHENLNQMKNATTNSKNDLLTDSQKIELIAQTVDQLATETDLLTVSMRQSLQNNQALQKETNQLLSQLTQNLSTLDQASEKYEKQVLNVVRWQTLAKKLLELFVYIGAIAVLFKALTTSLWETLGLKSLYEHFNGQETIQLSLMIAYSLLVLGFFGWIFRKIVKLASD